MRGVWRVSRPGVFVVVAVDVLAVILPLWMSGWRLAANTGRTWLILSVIVGLCALASAAVESAERFRFSLVGGPLADLLTVCTLASALVLPPWAAALAVGASYAFARGSWHGQPPYRWLYGVAAVAVSSMLVETFAGPSSGHGWWARAVAPTVYVLVDAALIAAAMLASGQRAKLRFFASKTGWLVNLGTAGIGVGFAAIIDTNLIFAPVVIPAVLATAWLASRSQMSESKALDPATGLLTESAWRAVAAQATLQPGPWTVALVIPVGASPADITTCVEMLSSMLRAGGMDRERDVIGRYRDGFAVLVSASVVATQNVMSRVVKEIARRNIVVVSSTGYGGGLGEQLADAACELFSTTDEGRDSLTPQR